MKTLEDLLSNPRFSNLELLTEPETLERKEVQAVEVSETPDVEYFVQDHTLILSTAMVFEEKQEKLLPFIDSLQRVNGAGLGIKTGRFLGKVDERVIEYANNHSFPIFHIPDNYTLGNLSYEFSNILQDSQEEEISFALDIQQRFSDLYTQGVGIKGIIQEFSQMIQQPVIFLSPFGKVLEASNNFGNPIKKAQHFADQVMESSQNSIKQKGYFQIQNTDGTIIQAELTEVPVHNFFPYFLIVLNPEKMIPPVSRFATHEAGLILSFIVQNIEDTDLSGQEEMTRKFIEDLPATLKTTNLDENLYKQILELGESLGFVTSDYYQVLGINIKENTRTGGLSSFHREERKMISLWIKNNISEYFPNAIFIPSPLIDEQDYIILQDEPSNLENILQDITSKMQLNLPINIIWNVGQAVDSLPDIASSFNQTKNVERERKQTNNEKLISFSHKSDAIALLRQLNTEDTKSFITTHLQDLAYPDNNKHLELRETLETFLNNQCEYARTAEKLFVHRNTVKYRIKKCEELLGKDVTEAETSFNLRLAFLLSR